MTVNGPADPQTLPPTPEELVEILSEPIRKVIEDDIETPNDPEKLYQYYNAQRNYLMYRGFQWTAPMYNNGYVSIGPVSGSSGSDQGEDGPAYDYVQNTFRGTGNKLIAAIGSRAPNVMVMPDDPDDEDMIRRAKNAQNCNEILSNWWDVDERSIEAALTIWTTGPAYLYTPYVADDVLYGSHSEPIIEIVNHPQAGPVPMQTGTRQYPNGRVQCHILGCDKVSTPFGVKADLDFCPWLDYAEEQNRGILLKAYPELRAMNIQDGPVSGGGTSNVTGRQTRDAIISPYGGTRLQSGNWTHRRIWFQPWMYELIADEEKRGLVYQSFPRGLKITMVQDRIVRLDHEKLSEVLSAIQPSPGAVLNSDPAGQDMVSEQILENHTVNICAETMERGLPITFARPDVFDFQRLREQRAKANQYLPTLPAIGERLADSMWESPAAEFSQQIVPFMNGFRQNAQNNVGVTEALWGGAQASTAREAEIQKNAALQGIAPIWMYFRKGFERAKRNGILQMCAFMSGVIRQGSLQADLSEVSQGGWHCEADEAIPVTWGQQQDRALFMMGQPPAILQAMGYMSPQNIENLKRLLGNPGWYVPGMDDYDKARATIAQLLNGQPSQGQDGTLQPSIPADVFEDNAQLMVQAVQGWAQKNWRLKDSNPGGYANVIAWGTAYQKLANPPTPPPPLPPAKLSLSGDITKMAPEVATALIGDFNLEAPPMPAQMQLGPGQMPPPQTPQGPQETVQ